MLEIINYITKLWDCSPKTKVRTKYFTVVTFSAETEKSLSSILLSKVLNEL